MKSRSSYSNASKKRKRLSTYTKDLSQRSQEFELSQTLLHPENVFSQMTAKIFQHREEAYLSTLHHFPLDSKGMFLKNMSLYKYTVRVTSQVILAMSFFYKE